jgi:hypothetical protein
MSGCFANQARGIIGTLAGVTLFIYCFYADAAASLSEVGRSLNIDKTQISVSGISSGGFMAHQFHVAHSSNVMGAGVVAGGPYYCAEGSIANAITKCSKFMAGRRSEGVEGEDSDNKELSVQDGWGDV